MTAHSTRYVTLTFDLMTPKPNQFKVIFVPRCTNDKSLAKTHQQILEISRKHSLTLRCTGGLTDTLTEARTEATKTHNLQRLVEDA